MYLRDIHLDLPYREDPEVLKEVMIQHNCSYEDAIKIDYNLNWKDLRRQFYLETRCMVSMFLRVLGRYKNKDCTKIVVDCVEEITRTTFNFAMGIGLVQYKLAPVDFFTKRNDEKKQIALQIIRGSVCTLAQDRGWDLAPLEEAFRKIEEAEYNNFYVYGKPVKSPTKQYTAELYIEHQVEAIYFYAVIRNKEFGIVEKKLIVVESPSEWTYMGFLGKLVWSSKSEIHLNNKEGFAMFTVPVNVKG